jgi:PAS domain S-box-containing protein
MVDKPSYEELEQRVKQLEKEALIRKQAEDALRESEKRYRHITEAITDYIYTVWIKDGRPVETTHGTACIAVTGYTHEEFSDDPYLWIQMVHEEDREAVEKQASQTLTGGKAEPIEHRIIRKDGAVRWVRNTPVLYFDGGGRLLSYDGLIQDVTERRMAEEAHHESEARYKGIVEYTINGLAVYRTVNEGEDFIFVDFNRAAERIEKIDREKVMGRSILDVFPSVKEFGLFEVLQRVWASGQPEHHPISLYEDERIVGWRDNFVYQLPSGEVVAVYTDETERKQAEEALRKANEELQNFSQELENKVQERTLELKEKTKQLVAAERLAAMGNMANRIAHEVRNSLMVVGGFARRMDEKTPEDDPNTKYLRTIVDEVKTLEKKVSEIIEIKKEE